jgi:outer membrane immunogenic protein
MIKRLVFAASAMMVMGAVQVAHAADIVEPAAPEIYDWTGLYVGGHIGYGWSKIDYESDRLSEPSKTDADGIIGGAQIGYNIQFDSIVVGPEISFTWTDLDDEEHAVEDTFGSDIDWYAIFGGRIGFAADRFLMYVRGGYALIDVGTDGFNPNIPAGFDDSETNDGFAIGAGIEHALTDNVIIGAEYMYVDVSDKDHDGNTDQPVPPFNEFKNSDVGGHIHAVTARVSFKFR